MNVLYRAMAWASAFPVLAVFVASPALAAPTFTVNSILDQPDDLTMPGTCHTSANTCTLRAAIMQANRTSGVGATIVLPAGTYTLTIPASGSDGETNGDLDLTTPAAGNPVITIAGAGATTTIIDANQIDRAIHVYTSRTVVISDVTVRNGFAPAANSFGGAIFNEGLLTVSHGTISGNQGSFGAGIFNHGVLSLTNSTLILNISNGQGGGILNFANSTVTMSGCTITQNGASVGGGGIYNFGTVYVNASTVDSNHANDGGGIFTQGSSSLPAALFMVDSTVAINTATDSGGGVFSSSTVDVNVYNTSIVFNSAGADPNSGGTGGGIFNDPAKPGTFNLRNSLVAGNNIDNSPIYDECTGTLNTFGANLLGADAACTIVGAWDKLNSFAFLGPLQNNGGPTATVALLPGSNAIDAADPFSGCVDYNSNSIPFDQRGQPRVSGGQCDIGAYEYNALAPPSFVGALSRKVHGAAGTFDLPLSAVATNPTTEPRTGPAQTIVFTFDKPISSATATVTAGIGAANVPTVSGNDVIVGLSGVIDQQYVTVSLSNVASSDGGTGGSGSVRIGFLAGDVNQNRVVSLADLGLVNAQLAQTVTAGNYLKDVNASGTLTLSDKGLTNANLAKALPAP